MKDCANLQVLRSMMFVPVNVTRFVEKAHLRGADAIILDLEDSIALSEKVGARERLQDVTQMLSSRRVDQIFVRINRPLRLAIPDLEAAISPLVTGIYLPKVHSVDHVRLISETITELEAERGMTVGSTQLGVRVETAQAFFSMERIAAADPRITIFGLGGEDFSLAIGVEPDVDTLIYPKQRAIIAAHAAGVKPIGLVGSGADFSDLDQMRTVVRQSRRYGFEGASCIHPAVVPILNEEFRPPLDQIVMARRVVSAFQSGIAAGTASVNLDGKMIDYPVAQRAERLIARHNAIEARELRNH